MDPFKNKSSTILSVNQLDIFYGRAKVISNLTLHVAKNETVVIFGRNGSGKTTTLKGIMGLIRTAKGQIDFQRQSLDRLKPYQICALGLGYVPEDRRIFTRLTVRENLEVGRRPPRPDTPPWTVDTLTQLFPPLKTMMNRPGGMISGGEQQMLTIARTLMGNPRLLLLDQPVEGLAPIVVDELARTLNQIKTKGVSILLAEQDLKFVRAVGDRFYLLDHGRICAQGSIGELTNEKYAQYLAV